MATALPISGLTTIPALADGDLFAIVDISTGETNKVEIQYFKDNYLAGANLVKVTLSNAAILQLFTNPVELIPAPGAGKAISLIKGVGRMVFNSVAYATNGTLNIYNNTVSLPLMQFPNSFTFNAVAGTTIHQNMPANSGSGKYILENTPVYIKCDTGNPTAGDSPIDLYLYYTIITL